LGVEAVDGFLVDCGVGQGVVVEAGGAGGEADLGLANGVRRSGIDAPVEAEGSCAEARLEALGFGCGYEGEGLTRGAPEEDHQGYGALRRAENCPVGGALALQAGVDDVFRTAGFEGLGDEAAAVGELSGYVEGKVGE